MTPRTLPNDTTLLDARSHIGFTHRRLRAHALTLALAPTFEALLSTWPAVHQKELEHDDNVDDAGVIAVSVDGELNLFAQRLSSSVLELTGNDRTHTLYLHFFEGKPLHLFIRPTLAGQLSAMQRWPASLQQSPHASLQALGAELPALLVKAEAAEAAVASAEQQRRQFRDVGERKLFIDDLNAARKETFGVLATLPHKHTGLPSRFAERFFRRDRSKPAVEPDIESVKASIDELKQELAEQEALLAALEKDHAEAKAAEEAQAKLEAEKLLAEIQKEIESKQEELAAIQAKLQTPAP